ncbi:hypothetical protein IP81_18640 [Novosphingobium sp. AAP83]|uniref:nucleoside hydrolase n=1 Tax=Novosphingobium sp. AAP83 TaxID=1523425 RepID=UPI0006B97DC5|nr:nucleoside hydrolase [Novosphingobium sp. AAP83]KPF87928.1 hypothetical protein IP81_18640 [Novosphingobium sp. AAP83]
MAWLNRREFGAGSLALALGSQALAAADGQARAARMRIIVDNDFGGDPDSLFQLAHFGLSPSVSIPLVVGSHYRDFGEADKILDKAVVSAGKAKELLGLIGRAEIAPIVAGLQQPLASRGSARSTAATAAIIREAMRTDTGLPLFYSAGGSLTDIATAWLAAPQIASRLRLVWIGGNEHPDLAPPPPGSIETEYNFTLDPLAARTIFNESDIEIWQVPRNAFRQMLFSHAELEELSRSGPLGKFLSQQIAATHTRLSANLPKFIFNDGESFMLGDTALVTLTALQSAFQMDTSSSAYSLRPTPIVNEDGSYTANPHGRLMRVYKQIDTRLTFADMLAKFRAADRALRAGN